MPTTNRSLTALLPAPRTSNSLGRASNERACCAARPLAPPPHLGQTSTPDSTHKRAYVGLHTNIDLVRQSNGPGNIQIASVKLRKYDARISGTKIASRVRCFSLPEQKSVRCEIAVVMRFCREYQGSAIPQRRNDQFCGIRYGWVSGLTRMHDGQAQDFVPLSVGEGISTPRLRGTFNDVTSLRASPSNQARYCLQHPQTDIKRTRSMLHKRRPEYHTHFELVPSERMLPTNRLEDWYAKLLFTRRARLIICVSGWPTILRLKASSTTDR